jgi:hypothetical protein
MYVSSCIGCEGAYSVPRFGDRVAELRHPGEVSVARLVARQRHSVLEIVAACAPNTLCHQDLILTGVFIFASPVRCQSPNTL